MSTYRIEDTTLHAIGDAIRLKRDTVDEINPEDMPLEIELIESGGGILPLGWEYYDTPIDTVFTYTSAPTQSNTSVQVYTYDGIPDPVRGAGETYPAFMQIGYIKYLGEDWTQHHFLESIHLSALSMTYGQNYYGVNSSVCNLSMSHRTNWGRYCTASGSVNGLVIDKVNSTTSNQMKIRYGHNTYEKCLAGDYAVKLVRYKFDPSKIIGLL